MLSGLGDLLPNCDTTECKKGLIMVPIWGQLESNLDPFELNRPHMGLHGPIWAFTGLWYK